MAGDWDTHDVAGVFVERSPGEQCTEFVPFFPGARGMKQCPNRAPVGHSICTPCYRDRLKVAAGRRAQAAVSPGAWYLWMEKNA